MKNKHKNKNKKKQLQSWNIKDVNKNKAKENKFLITNETKNIKYIFIWKTNFVSFNEGEINILYKLFFGHWQLEQGYALWWMGARYRDSVHSMANLPSSFFNVINQANVFCELCGPGLSPKAKCYQKHGLTIKKYKKLIKKTLFILVLNCLWNMLLETLECCLHMMPDFVRTES